MMSATPHQSFDQRPRAVLFDCDGTLLLTGDLHFHAISSAVARQGAEMPRAWYSARTGLGRSDLFARFQADFDLSLDVDRLSSDSIALTISMADLARENPTVSALARDLAGRLPIAVVTNSEAAVALAVLRATGLAGLFDAILTVNDVTRPKPAPDLFLLAAQRLGVLPQHCLVLEDSEQGIQAAMDSGMACHDVRTEHWPGHAKDLSNRLELDAKAPR
jgi:beta-phosphoglucomutase-like phosphatase (HAD superfamily)